MDETPLLVGRSHGMPNGTRVRLRLIRGHDIAGVRRLLQQQGIDPSPQDLERLVRFDPRSRLVICATVLSDGRERLVALGTIDLDGRARHAPDMLLLDREIDGNVRDLISTALVARANSVTARHAA